ncbi:MAG: 16S rRNA (adenine(1518)-N(6)/adenine(1519)-N(6))-dimethyltransferase RsmA [Pseudomonadota bacterium]
MTERPAHRPRKRFGQHFLTDTATVSRIVRQVHPAGGLALVEIGPGLGALTLPLLRACKTLHALELDRDLVPRLARAAADIGDLTVHQGDALAFDFTALSQSLETPLRLVGNLPYNISTPLLFHVCEHKAVVESMHFMLQKEVVDRMAAAPGSKAYGRLSVMLRYHCGVVPRFDVPPTAFDPPPRVDSAVVSLVPHATPPFDVGSLDVFHTVVSTAFNARRKTLRNALSGLLDDEHIAAAGVDPRSRAERITPDGYAALSRQLGALQRAQRG